MATTPPLPPGSVPPLYPPAQKSGWWSRNWKWFIPTLFFVIFVLPLTMCGGIVYFVMSTLKNSDVARESLARAQSNSVLMEKLGAPIQMGAWIGGSVNENTTTGGRANLVIPISGPKGKGTLFVVARKTSNEWQYVVMHVMVQGGGTVNLLTTAERKPRDDSETPSFPSDSTSDQ
jgi:hypothetical protein